MKRESLLLIIKNRFGILMVTKIELIKHIASSFLGILIVIYMEFIYLRVKADRESFT